jgi:hypothetical protein
MGGASNRAGSFGDKISTRTGGSDIFNLGGNYFVSYRKYNIRYN